MSGPNGLIKKLDKALDPYLSPSDGLLKSRSEMLAMRKTALESNKESLEKIYQRVLKVQTLKYDRLSNLIDNMMNTINTLDQQANF